MKKLLSGIVCVCILTCILCGTVCAAGEAPFNDVPADAPYADAVAFLKDAGIVNGDGGNFYPESNITRAEFVKMLLLTCGVEIKADFSGVEAFADVPESEWYYSYMMTARAEGLVNGDDQNHANPDANITRQEMVVIVYRAATQYEVTLPNVAASQLFSDDADIEDWAYSPVITIKNAGLIAEEADGRFRPQEFATRAEVAVLLAALATL